jgi:hypothetical protein
MFGETASAPQAPTPQARDASPRAIGQGSGRKRIAREKKEDLCCALLKRQVSLKVASGLLCSDAFVE